MGFSLYPDGATLHVSEANSNSAIAIYLKPPYIDQTATSLFQFRWSEPDER
jgi:hypothetical protein